MANTEWRADLGARTTEVLGRFGVAGRVEVENRLVWLIGHGPTVEVNLTESDAASAAQNPTQLKELAERLARELSRARRKAIGQTGTQANWLAWLKLIPPIAIVAIGVWLAFRYLLPHESASKDATTKGARLSRGLQNPTPKLAEKQLLDDQNCLRTVNRIQQGGTVTSLDIDGWVVELSLVGSQNDLAPGAEALNEHFQMRPGGLERIHHSVYTPILNQTDANQSGVLISKDPFAAISPRPSSGILITWRGQYVAPYFQQTERAEYLKLAGVLFEALHASYGALYARCVQGPPRYLGSWFRGPDVGGALWMLVAEMEVASGSARLKLSEGVNAADELRSALQHLADAVQPITRKRAAYLLASSGGTVSERVGTFATVEFPFSPGNRANLASSTLASKIWQ